MAEHRVIGVGLCSCGDACSLRWMDCDEWSTGHQDRRALLIDFAEWLSDQTELDVATPDEAVEMFLATTPLSPGSESE